jgi:predicted nucleic acid-binding Zn ribbon protein
VRRLAPRRLELALGELTERLAPATTLARVQARWADAVGDAVAREAAPVSEREGVVTVACESAVWAQEIDLLSAELVDRLNDRIGSAPVRSLRVVVGGARRA